MKKVIFLEKLLNFIVVGKANWITDEKITSEPIQKKASKLTMWIFLEEARKLVLSKYSRNLLFFPVDKEDPYCVISAIYPNDIFKSAIAEVFGEGLGREALKEIEPDRKQWNNFFFTLWKKLLANIARVNSAMFLHEDDVRRHDIYSYHDKLLIILREVIDDHYSKNYLNEAYSSVWPMEISVIDEGEVRPGVELVIR